MPAFANLVLKDHADADVTFVPHDITGNVATTVNSNGVGVGDKTASWSLSKTSAGRRKAALKLTVPVVQDTVISGISRPTVVRAAYCTIEFSFDGTSTTVERQDLLAFAKAFLGNTAQIKPVIEDYAAAF
jgi:hypothetical protein